MTRTPEEAARVRLTVRVVAVAIPFVWVAAALASEVLGAPLTPGHPYPYTQLVAGAVAAAVALAMPTIALTRRQNRGETVRPIYWGAVPLAPLVVVAATPAVAPFFGVGAAMGALGALTLWLLAAAGNHDPTGDDGDAPRQAAPSGGEAA